MEIQIHVATSKHVSFAEEICKNYAESAKERGTGIAKRQPAYITEKILSGKAVIALEDNVLAGFCYIETWSHGKYVANSGLIVVPSFRKRGLAKKIKAKVFELSQNKFPAAKVFGITTIPIKYYDNYCENQHSNT